MRKIADKALGILSSLGLSCVLLLLLGLLTWLGTLEQVEHGLYEVQRKYFESFVLVHHLGPIPIPLPGANLVLCVLFVNLVVGGMVRMRGGWSKAGILVVHVGIAFMLLAGFVKLYFSDDGHVTLFEGQGASAFQSYHRWEIAITGRLDDGRLRTHLVPQEDFLDVPDAGPVRLTTPDLPFDLEVERFYPNCGVLPKGPMFEVDVPVVDGAFLKEQARKKESEANIAGAYVAVVDASGRRTEGVLWGADAHPWTVSVEDAQGVPRDWAVDLRRERYPMPFAIVLDDFTKEDHPRTGMPRSFESDVTVHEAGTANQVKISMNEPLRKGGLVVYQASWGPSTARPGDPLFSTLSVVRNPADQLPLVGCIVIAAGLLLHFGRKLGRWVQAEVRPS